MDPNRASIIFFSPTGSTKKVLNLFCSYVDIAADELDITPHTSDCERIFERDELAVFGAPTFAGRMPEVAAHRFSRFKGNGTPAVVIVTYGNRTYGGALRELSDIVKKNGFTVVAAAAFVTEHSVMHSVAAGRPDDSDTAKIASFASDVISKLKRYDSLQDLSEISIPGEIPLKKNGMIFRPAASSVCTRCGICSPNCPVNAIPVKHPRVTDKNRCISCMRCVSLCPIGERYLNGIIFSLAEDAFRKKYGGRKEPEIFI